MPRNLTVLLSVIVMAIGFNYPIAYSISGASPEKSQFTNKGRKEINKGARKQAKKYVQSEVLPLGIGDLDPSIRPGGTLPPGIMLRGVIGLYEGGTPANGLTQAGHGVSFGGYQLPTRPVVQIIGVGQPGTVECPGSASAPAATSGFLCVYLASTKPGAEVGVFDAPNNNGIRYTVDTQMTLQFGNGAVSRMGFTAFAFRPSTDGFAVAGTWAVQS